jgi:hypothetical protein
LNAAPTLPNAVVPLLITGTVVTELMVTVNVAELVPPTFAALMVTLLVPEVVGVPVIAPVLVFTLNPAGKPVAL